jgi:hypothetical protein
MATNNKPKRSKAPSSYLAKLYRNGVKAGQPAKYSTPQQLRDKIQKYFEEIDEDSSSSSGEPLPTQTGLALYLGFASRQSLYDYQKRNDKFSYIIEGAKTLIERYHEIRVSTVDRPQGSIFVLQNMGWTTKVEVKDTSETPRQVFKIGGLEVEF